MRVRSRMRDEDLAESVAQAKSKGHVIVPTVRRKHKEVQEIAETGRTEGEATGKVLAVKQGGKRAEVEVGAQVRRGGVEVTSRGGVPVGRRERV